MGLGAGLGSWDRAGCDHARPGGDLKVGPDAVQFRPEIEPVVRWIEETPRDRALEVAIAHLKEGLSYRDLLAGLFLAGIRNIKPHPVGFKFHAVMVINSAHLLGQTAVGDRTACSPCSGRSTTSRTRRRRTSRKGTGPSARSTRRGCPKPDKARAEFVRAMEAWDADAADAAVAALCRTSGAAETMEPIWRMAVRDQRNIGHKPIFAAQSWRTLQAIGWQHAEPVLRSLAFGLLDLHGDSRPVAVGPYEANLENAGKVRDDWQAGKPDPGATRSLLEVMRQATPEDASAEAVKLLNQGVAAELALGRRRPLRQRAPDEKPGDPRHPRRDLGERPALHLRSQRRRDDPTPGPAPGRRLAAPVPGPDQAQGRPDDRRPVDSLNREVAKGDEAVGEIFETINDGPEGRGKAAGKTVGYLERGGSTDLIFAAARRMIFHKGRDSHDYKFGAAAWEECELADDPKWRAPLAAAMMFNLPGAKTADSPLMKRAREAVASVLG